MKFKCIFSALIILFSGIQGFSQKYYTRDGNISFHSDAPLEKIEAINSKVSSVLDVKTGDLEFSVLIKSFRFEKALMEEHFNENYMESSKYPRGSFKGKVDNIASIDITANGEHKVQVKGELTIRGITKPLEATGVLKTGPDGIHATSTFQLMVADFNIEIPKVVRENIARIVDVRVDILYKPLEQ
jgi:hypothetical protein